MAWYWIVVTCLGGAFTYSLIVTGLLVCVSKVQVKDYNMKPKFPASVKQSTYIWAVNRSASTNHHDYWYGWMNFFCFVWPVASVFAIPYFLLIKTPATFGKRMLNA